MTQTVKIIHGQKVTVKIYPMGYAVAPKIGRVYIAGSLIARIKGYARQSTR